MRDEMRGEREGTLKNRSRRIHIISTSKPCNLSRNRFREEKY